MPQNEDEEVSNHIIMARTKTEGKAMTDTLPEEKSSVSNVPIFRGKQY